MWRSIVRIVGSSLLAISVIALACYFLLLPIALLAAVAEIMVDGMGGSTANVGLWIVRTGPFAMLFLGLAGITVFTDRLTRIFC